MHNIRIIFRREMRSYFNSPMAYIFLVIFALINGYFFTRTFFLFNQSDMRSLFNIIPLVYLFFIPAAWNMALRMISPAPPALSIPTRTLGSKNCSSLVTPFRPTATKSSRFVWEQKILKSCPLSRSSRWATNEPPKMAV